jgi:hypothetical protein
LTSIGLGFQRRLKSKKITMGNTDLRLGKIKKKKELEREVNGGKRGKRMDLCFI